MIDILIFGASGHTKVVCDLIEREGKYRIRAFIDPAKSSATWCGIPVEDDEWAARQSIRNGLIAVGDNFLRSRIRDTILERMPDFRFVSAVHPSAVLGRDVRIGEGSVILAGAIVNAGTEIGAHVILNTRTSVDHDSRIGSFSSLAPGCTTGGDVIVGEYTAIGLGANLRHGIHIGEHSVLGVGAAVLDDVESYTVAYGVPARPIRKRVLGEKYL